MKLETGDFCPLVNGPCKKFECKWWIQIRGNNPQTGQEIDEWDCTVALLPMLIIESSQQSRSTAAAVESFRNISTEQNKKLHDNLLEAQKIVPAIVSAALNNKGAIEGSK